MPLRPLPTPPPPRLHRRDRIVRRLAGAFAAAALWPASGGAQGPAYREHWGYLHLEHRRAEVLRELAGRDAADLAAVAALCASPDAGVPFRPVAAALAHLRGVSLDGAFLLRASVGVYVLPEVVDPAASIPECRDVNLSVFLPFTLPSPGAIAFDVVVRRAGGDELLRERLTRDTGIDDLRMARPKVTVPCAQLADGSYEVEVGTWIDGEAPRPRDPRLGWSFHVLRGYQQRSEAAVAAARAARDGLGALPRALLDGMVVAVARAYGGEAFAVRSDAVAELERLERAVDNIREGRPLFDGIPGPVRTALPASGGALLPCVLRDLPGDAQGGAVAESPLLVFVSGAPAYDAGARRPIAPAAREAPWLAAELGEFGRARGWRIACLDSAGGGRPFGKDLLAALGALRELLPSGARKPVLVCDREAAGIVALSAGAFAPHIAGLVLIGGGALPGSAIEALGALPVRWVRLAHYPGTAGVDRTLAFVAERAAGADTPPDLRRLHDRELPWPFGVALSLPEIEAFAGECFGR